MEWFINFSTWVETNSGQIQIIIALGAIWLAWKAYEKVLEQMKIANEQRLFELRFKAVEYLIEYTNKIKSNHEEYPQIIKELDLIIEHIEKTKPHEAVKITKSKEKIKNAHLKQKATLIEADKLIKRIKNGENINIQFLEKRLLKFTEFSVLLATETPNIKVMVDCVEELKKINNMIDS